MVMILKAFVLFAPVLLSFAFLYCVVNAKREIQTKRPIIGVLAQSTDGMEFKNLGKYYIAASYVKFLESSGARVVPIPSNLTEAQVKKLFKSINGALFPGGLVDLFTSGYAITSRLIFDQAVKTFDEGGYFPIMGMCLGHQILATFVNGPHDIRIPTDSDNMTAPLNMPYDYQKSKLFRNIPQEMVKSINETLTTAHFHDYSLPLKLFEGNKKIKEFYKVLTTNIDRSGKNFVSTMEAKKYPFYSMQWHPEKCSFEWSTRRSIPHDPISIELAQYISNFFVQEAKFSNHKFPSKAEEIEAMIYNYNPIFTGADENNRFHQTYIFT